MLLNKCRVCGCEIRFWISICTKCKDRRNYHAAIISTNKKRLIKKLNERNITPERAESIEKISNNILQNTKELFKYN